MTEESRLGREVAKDGVHRDLVFFRTSPEKEWRICEWRMIDFSPFAHSHIRTLLTPAYRQFFLDVKV
jgi:hypothetical protein